MLTTANKQLEKDMKVQLAAIEKALREQKSDSVLQDVRNISLDVKKLRNDSKNNQGILRAEIEDITRRMINLNNKNAKSSLTSIELLNQLPPSTKKAADKELKPAKKSNSPEVALAFHEHSHAPVARMNPNPGTTKPSTPQHSFLFRPSSAQGREEYFSGAVSGPISAYKRKLSSDLASDEPKKMESQSVINRGADPRLRNVSPFADDNMNDEDGEDDSEKDGNDDEDDNKSFLGRTVLADDRTDISTKAALWSSSHGIWELVTRKHIAAITARPRGAPIPALRAIVVRDAWVVWFEGSWGAAGVDAGDGPEAVVSGGNDVGLVRIFGSDLVDSVINLLAETDIFVVMSNVVVKVSVVATETTDGFLAAVIVTV
ncbi:uncharacterized protein KY384_004106 [Bacidia gigantensis]|uniref:uncharacterized protein n=1 Tax=Bacidia gigantensis TaxID=2732470 RepID=UPI001D04F5F8|nr:uncharacterized protein KY384_004106 [Bacidia gigantensis]KAG8530749.1 hypothetical protein KY384_004106 [Bacidia gigantensis]